MPGSYSASDIFRYFFPGFLIVFLVGITYEGGPKLVSDQPVFTVLSAFIIGTLFYNAYRYCYGLTKKCNKSPADEYLRKEFLDCAKLDDPDINEAAVKKYFKKNDVHNFINRHFVESNTNHMNYQNKIVSAVHLNYMNTIILAAYALIVVVGKYLCNKKYLLNYCEPIPVLIIVPFVILAILTFLAAKKSDKMEENQEKLFLVNQDKTEVFKSLLNNSLGWLKAESGEQT